MKKFLYVRIVAMLILAFVCLLMVITVSNQLKHFSAWRWWAVPLSVLFSALFGLHSFSVLHLYTRYYPHREVPKAMVIFYRIAAVSAVLCLGLSLFTVIVNLFFPVFSETERFPEVRYGEISVGSVITVLLVIQLVGGSKMFRSIRLNARKQLEDSFA